MPTLNALWEVKQYEFPEHTISSDLKTWVIVCSLKHFAVKVTILVVRRLLTSTAGISINRDYQEKFTAYVIISIKVHFWFHTQYKIYVAILITLTFKLVH